MAPYTPLRRLTDGIAARVAEHDAETVLWLHEHTLDSRVWAPVWEALPWRHVGVDLPGHGVSLPADRRTPLPAFADRIIEAAAPLGVSHVVGHGLGALVGLQVALARAEPLASLTLMAPMMGGGPHDPDRTLRYREVLSMFQLGGLGPHLGGRWMTESPGIFDGVDRTSPLWTTAARVVARHTWSELLEGTLRRLLEHVHDDAELSALRVPVQVLVGEREVPAAHDVATRLAATLPRCRTRVVPGAGHFGLWTHAAEYVPLLRGHVEDARPVPA